MMLPGPVVNAGSSVLRGLYLYLVCARQISPLRPGHQYLIPHDRLLPPTLASLADLTFDLPRSKLHHHHHSRCALTMATAIPSIACIGLIGRKVPLS